MDINADTKLFCLIGHPISKSLSPAIHNYSFEQNEINARYVVFDVDKGSLEDAVKGIKSLNIQGFNVTIPHKVDIIRFLDEIDEEASLLGTVNTVNNLNGKLIGHNTDGRGFIQALDSHNIDIKNKNIVIIGAGGAARAISMIMAKDEVKSIQIVNRTLEKGKNLAKEISIKFPNVICKWTDISNINPVDADVVINCTSVGMYPEMEETVVNPCIFNKKTVICDIVYKPFLTKFLSLANQNGYKIMGGLDMLVNQAILSEEIWINKKINREFFTIKKKDFVNLL